MGKIKISPVGGVSTGESKPHPKVDVKTTSGYYGIKGKYDFDGGTSISGSVTKDFAKGKVDFPGGSQKFKADIKPYFEISISKKIGSGGKQPDLSKYVDEKKKGGAIAIGCGKIMKDRKKKTKRY